jgi:hypothetical protein
VCALDSLFAFILSPSGGSGSCICSVAFEAFRSAHESMQPCRRAHQFGSGITIELVTLNVNAIPAAPLAISAQTN